MYLPRVASSASGEFVRPAQQMIFNRKRDFHFG
jgi:hypothetical protein